MTDFSASCSVQASRAGNGSGGAATASASGHDCSDCANTLMFKAHGTVGS